MIETNVTVLNEISAKLGGKSDATLVVEALNNIANAMGDTEPDKLKTVSEALADILQYIGGDEPTGTKLFEGNVTTANHGGDIYYEFDPVLALNYSSLIVEFEGTKYTASNIASESEFEFGAPLEEGIGFDWDDYPFNLWYGDADGVEQTTISTETAGTYSLKIWANSDPVE